jgi:hypothetical protein
MKQTNLKLNWAAASPAEGICPQRLLFIWTIYALAMGALWHLAGSTWSQTAIWMLALAIGACLAPSLWEV